ncbi:MAG: HAD-IC family P-type ATPase, partial [Candidatus Altiarchaeota archaeon]|nr:HAD-IC family P-type ATPase [Candidatus Altiarchaeota archaeon]
MAENWHSIGVKEALEALDSGIGGLSLKQVEERIEKTGFNELQEMERETPLQMFLSQFKNFLVIILIIAALVSAGVEIIRDEEGKLVEPIAILLVVVFITVIGFIQEYKAEKGLAALKKMISVDAKVVRDNRRMMIPARELVPGDLIYIEAGDRIPADCRLLEVIDLKVDEASLTGESTAVEKNISELKGETALADRRNMVYMGTNAIYGKGNAVVVKTGMNTELGRIAEKIQTMEREKTPLQLRLDRVGKQIGLIVIALCLIIFTTGILKEENINLEVILGMGLMVIALAVAAVPEGLPAVVTVTLAKGMNKMVEKNAIVRKLTAVETLGCTTFICSDKTGTLTRNEMTVRRMYVDGKVIDVSGEGYQPHGEFSSTGEFDKGGEEFQLLLRISSLCNNASLEKKEGMWSIIGDPTEAALVVVASKAGLWQGQLNKEYPRLAEVPFSSERKRMSTVHRKPDGENIAYVKGAPDIILELCSHISVNGEVREITREDKE